jgi:hypothetical protein
MGSPRVTRRKALAGGASVAVAGIGGWWAFGRDEPGPLDDLPDGIQTAEFAWSREESKYVDQQQLPESGYLLPQIRVAGDSVRVRGVLVYGSSECNVIHIEALTYRNSTVRVGIGTDKKDSGWFDIQSCSDDLDDGSYLLEMTVESQPAKIVATAHNRQGRAETTTHEFDSTPPEYV